MKKKKVSISWSGGKDSAFALYKAMQLKSLEVVSLHTGFNDKLKRVGMHGTPESLIEAQAAALKLPLHKIYIPENSSNISYEQAMLLFYQEQKKSGIDAIVFGDIFLEDLRSYRESLTGSAGLSAIFPLWGKPTRALITDFLQKGFKTTICAANANLLSKEVTGKLLDKHFLETLSGEVDPCGENGEFHTFVHDGPLFSSPVSFHVGEVISKSYSIGEGSGSSLEFWFAELEAKAHFAR